MKTGFRGTFVISWSQTVVDGLEAAPVQALNVGAAWSWRGDAVRVDGPSDILRLEQADGEAELRKRAARMVRRLVGAAVAQTPQAGQVDLNETLRDSSFVVTDGAKTYTVTLINVGRRAQPLLMFLDEVPPRDADLWIVHHTLDTAVQTQSGAGEGGIICFTPGTLIRCEDGPRAVEDLREGDRVLTKDSGAQEIQWTGSRRMSGARLFAMPKLRPIRIRTGALGIERPDAELLVSPEHRMLIQGDEARALFNTSEVLVAAKDLVNGSDIVVDLKVRQVTYVHLLLPSHQIVWANGVETESFHPANAALGTLSPEDRRRLLEHLPQLEQDPLGYGDFARRNLSASEAAILGHEAA
ncbi:hemolysin-type calcium-binding protein [Litorivita pollutaquae]|uniref:Hemolysin-type calcium-binding protein n=1 Tax=Litorivita pollutaquae TaxID=2200892 RepID=A0A2V4NBX0_9RHOB|nr:Hint domain-containing protein [Litorivita pollutaquae]PYC47200.1 hemolysin-type calcium-binding protein [Litorivita pollutaquae]